jgi:hypothetical protein
MRVHVREVAGSICHCMFGCAKAHISLSATETNVSIAVSFRPGGPLTLRPVTCPTSEGLPAADCAGFEIQVCECICALDGVAL